MTRIKENPGPDQHGYVLQWPDGNRNKGARRPVWCINPLPPQDILEGRHPPYPARRICSRAHANNLFLRPLTLSAL